MTITIPLTLVFIAFVLTLVSGDSAAYLAFVLNGLNGLNGEYGDIEGGTPLSRVLEIQA